MKRLKELRLRNKLNQSKVAMDTHISQSNISGYENGNRHPDSQNLYRLCKYYNVSADFLLELSDIEKPLLGSDLTQIEIEFLNIYRNLDKFSQYKAIGYVTRLKEECYK